ncbi:MAG: metal ABC transporter ATP-binding protein [Chlamydiales bacterium]
MKKSALKIQHLTVAYEKTPALWDLSLDIPAGQLVAIVGPNGAGKSTLLKAVLGMVKPVVGYIACLGEKYKKVRHKIAYVPQCGSVDWDFPMTVFDLVLMGCYRQRKYGFLSTKSERRRVLEALEKVEMTEFMDRQISQLSCGQRQRIFLARSLVQEAELFFLDEPFAGIDAASSATVFRILKELREEGKTIFVVHHDLQSVEQTFDWVILLNKGLVASGPKGSAFTHTMIERAYGREMHEMV